MSAHEEAATAVDRITALVEKATREFGITPEKWAEVTSQVFETPTWAEVNVSNLLAERDQLAATLRQRDVEDGLAATLWTAALAEVTGQRDRARAIAVRLEQELALEEEIIDAEIVGEDDGPLCGNPAIFGMSTVRCLLDAHGPDVQHRWGDLAW